MSGEVANIGCFVETVMVSNGNEDGAEIEAAQILKSKFEAAENPLGAIGLTEVSCDRCQATFLVSGGVDGRQAAIFFGAATNGSEVCNRSAGKYARGMGVAREWILNVNLSNVAERG
jgi:hypothetical protein